MNIDGHVNCIKTYIEIQGIKKPKYSPYTKRATSDGINGSIFC